MKTNPLHHFLRCALCTNSLTFSFNVKEEEVDEKIIPKMTEFSEGVGCYMFLFNKSGIISGKGSQAGIHVVGPEPQSSQGLGLSSPLSRKEMLFCIVYPFL